tara:strand:+ start:4558 stop:5607 length:1050 start_codon:yes stop_codon:yes gene_type:complete
MLKRFFFRKKLKPLLFIFLVIVIELIKLDSNFIENFYSNLLYKKSSSVFIYIFSSIPFSVGDILYLLVPFIIYSIVRKTNTRRKNLKNLFYFFTTIYMLFQVQWGLNYHRIPLKNKLEIKENYNTNSLIETTNLFIKQTNKIHLKISKNDTLAVLFNDDNSEIYKASIKAAKTLENNTVIKNKMKYVSVKNSLFSTPLSYMGFGGYINPFTLEAQINRNIPAIQIPTTICHEMAHQIGYSAENEANFIGILAAVSSSNNIVKYSGNVLALRYLLNELYKIDKKSFDQLYLKINKGVLKNIKQAEEELEKFRNPFEPYLKSIYDRYLKANNQTAGIKSYSLVVNLLVNYY